MPFLLQGGQRGVCDRATRRGHRRARRPIGSRPDNNQRGSQRVGGAAPAFELHLGGRAALRSARWRFRDCTRRDRRDQRGHGRVRHRRPPLRVGQGVAAHGAVGPPQSQGPHRERQTPPQGRSRPDGHGSSQVRHLPRRPLPAPRQANAQSQGIGRHRTVDPRHHPRPPRRPNRQLPPPRGPLPPPAHQQRPPDPVSSSPSSKRSATPSRSPPPPERHRAFRLEHTTSGPPVPTGAPSRTRDRSGWRPERGFAPHPAWRSRPPRPAPRCNFPVWV